MCAFTEQVKELRHEVIRQEDQLREVRKNSTNLEKKLEYERWMQTRLQLEEGSVYTYTDALPKALPKTMPVWLICAFVLQLAVWSSDSRAKSWVWREQEKSGGGGSKAQTGALMCMSHCKLSYMAVFIHTLTFSLKLLCWVQSLLENRKADPGVRQVDLELDSNKRKENEIGAEHHTVAIQQHDGPALKGSMHKPTFGLSKTTYWDGDSFFILFLSRIRWDG